MRLRRHMLFGAAVMLGTAAIASPSEFLTKALKGDNSEARLGHIASVRASSAKVKDFGRMLEQDHREARRQATAVAVRHHVRVPSAMAPEAKTEERKLRHLHGAAFDREFARYMVEDHRDDIADFQKEAKSGDPADLRGLARNTLPVLLKHLETAQSVR